MNTSLLKIIGMFLIFIVIIALTSFGLLKDFGSSGGVDADAVKEIVAEYIQQNPQAILDSVNKHQQNAAAEEDKKAQNSIKDKLAEIENNPASPFAGNKNGDVVIAEFFDYSCGYCKKVLPTVTKILEEDKNIKFVFKEFPILGPNSELSARAALAVNNINPNKYFEFHKKLMSNHVSGQASLNALATELGIDASAMEKQMKTPQIDKIIANERELASSIGIRGTPAFIIGGELVPGAVDADTLKELVAKARAKKGGQS